MKKTKLLSLLLAVILLAGCAPLNGITGAARVGLPLAQRANAAGEGIPGDVDGDGAVTPADARFVLRAAVGLDDSDMVLDMTLG
ncbi:MAG: hypothetical protein IJK98_05190, partial [Clostridia bacterium]|nr:hypothetical protein [Clostridia bacterium]